MKTTGIELPDAVSQETCHPRSGASRTELNVSRAGCPGDNDASKRRLSAMGASALVGTVSNRCLMNDGIIRPEVR